MTSYETWESTKLCKQINDKTYLERLQEIGISRLHSMGPFSAFCTPDIAPEGFPVIILYL